MSYEYTWKETSHEVYRAIFNQHKEDLSVFATASYDDYWLTEWGFKTADQPLIKSLRTVNKGCGVTPDEQVWEYYILHKVSVDD
jgi:N-acetylglutamate synthase-like GNAT family acetyltransferase